MLKHLLSYFHPVTLYSGRSLQGTPIVVRLVAGQPTLTVDGFAESNPTLLHLWIRLFRATAALRVQAPAPELLLLGLGGGSIVNYLRSHHPRWQLTVVDNEPIIIDVAQRFFGLRPSPNLHLITEDAALFLRHSHGRYDLIIVDLYAGDTVPAFITSPEFLESLYRALLPGSQVLFNYSSLSFGQVHFASLRKALQTAKFTHVQHHQIFGHRFFSARSL